MTQHHRIAIVGTGFAGLGMAIRLRQEGEEDFVLLERADDIGGTWRDNTYPGCACDVPSHLYSFSFAPNPDWSRTFSPQAEILDYLKRLRRALRRDAATSASRRELESARWDDDERRWRIETSRGALTADVLIAAQGPLQRPVDARTSRASTSFEGTAFHSAQWDHDHDLTGERVAVIGTGASAIQFVPRSSRRSASCTSSSAPRPWVIPHRNRPMKRWRAGDLPALPAGTARHAGGDLLGARARSCSQFRHRAVGKLLERIADDAHAQAGRGSRAAREAHAGLQHRLQAHPRRPTSWYPALAQPNVEVVTGGRSPRCGRTRSSPRTAREREVDTIIFGTGFHVTDIPIADRVSGRDGRTLAEVWQGSMQAYKGTTVAGYPEPVLPRRAEHRPRPHLDRLHDRVARSRTCSTRCARCGAAAPRTVEVREEAQRAYNAELDRMTEGTVWVTGGCTSYYIDRNGHNSALWPTYTWPFRRRLREFDAAAYALGTVAPRRRWPRRRPSPASSDGGAAGGCAAPAPGCRSGFRVLPGPRAGGARQDRRALVPAARACPRGFRRRPCAGVRFLGRKRRMVRTSGIGESGQGLYPGSTFSIRGGPSSSSVSTVPGQ